MMHRFLPILTSSWTRFAAVAAAALVISTSSAEAQRPVPVKPKPQTQQGQRRDQVVPPGFLPPAGMCRIWINDVPPGQQPAPTDCASAVRNRPSNGRVIFGDDYVKPRKNDRKDRRPTSDSASDPRSVVSRPWSGQDVSPPGGFADRPRIRGPYADAE